MAKASARQAGKRRSKAGAANRGHKKGQGALKAGSAFKYSNAASKTGRTAPNGETRVQAAGSQLRTESTIKRLNMYKKKPDHKRMKEQPTGPCRIQPDRRWFGNTRVIAQGKMQAFRETVAKGVKDPFSVVLKASKLPMSLLRETEEKPSRMDLLSVQPFTEVFSKRRQQKRAKLGSYDLEGLLQSVDRKSEGYSDGQDRRALVDSSTGLDKAAPGSDFTSNAHHKKEEIFDKGTSRRIWGELYKVVDASDVIIEVLDARDPMGTRCLQLERELRKNRAHKHIVLVLNKVDLVPTWVSRRWIQVLMRDFPTVAFHASITNPFGKNSLLNLLRQFGQLLKDKKHVTVGLIGYPNVGKSSIINTLKRKKVCKAAPVPGETRVWQYIALTRRLYLLDCPGIVPPSTHDFDADCAKVLKGVVRAERIQSPSDYIDEVMSRVKRQYLLQRYKLPPGTEWAKGEEFLSILAKKMGKLFKGGDPDLDTAARIVLYDWQRGRIPFFTPPPEEPAASSSAPAPAVGSAAGSAAGFAEEPPAGAGPGAPAAAGDGSLAGGGSSPGEEPAVTDQASAEVSAEAAAEAAAEATRAALTALAVQQPLGDLACRLAYDEEDRQGDPEAPARAGAVARQAAPGERGAAERGERWAAKLKRRRAQREAAVEAHDSDAPPARGRPKRRRLRGATDAADAAVAAAAAARRGAVVREGAVDWQAVASEFAM